MKRLDLALGIVGAATLIAWSWLTWPDPVTALGVSAVVVPTYLSLVSVMRRQDADREWMDRWEAWAWSVDAKVNPPADERPKPNPADIPTQPDQEAVRIVGGAVRRDRVSLVKPSPQPRATGATAVSALADDDWRKNFKFRGGE